MHLNRIYVKFHQLFNPKENYQTSLTHRRSRFFFFFCCCNCCCWDVSSSVTFWLPVLEKFGNSWHICHADDSNSYSVAWKWFIYRLSFFFLYISSCCKTMKKLDFFLFFFELSQQQQQWPSNTKKKVLFFKTRKRVFVYNITDPVKKSNNFQNLSEQNKRKKNWNFRHCTVLKICQKRPFRLSLYNFSISLPVN